MRDVATLFREYVRLDRKRTSGGLNVEELERWRRLKRGLTREFSPRVNETAIDRRASVRVPTLLQVSFETEGELVGSMMTNLSRYGVFIQTNRPFELKTCFELQIHVTHPERKISAPVEVVSVGVGPKLDTRQRGMGCRFVDPTPDVEKQIVDLYEQALKLPDE